MQRLKVYTAARIRTMDPGRPVADAVAISDGKIVSVGSIESMQPWLRRVPHDIDETFSDKVILPGFIDPHTHLRLSGTYMGLNYVGPIDSTDPNGKPLKGLPNRNAVLSRLNSLTRDRTEAVVAWGYDPGMQGGHLDRDLLDEISSEVPIWVIAYAPHIVYTNTPMIKRIGVDENTRVHGVGRYSDGRLNGWFIETEATALASRPVKKEVFGKGFGLASLQLQGRVAVKSGVTTTADMIYGIDSFEREWEDHSTAIEQGLLPLRVLLVPFESRLRKQFGDEFLSAYESMNNRSTDRLAIHGVKFVNDGSYPSMTLRLNFPGYLDGEVGLTGEVPWEDMFDRMLPFWRSGIQIHSHANGDETVDMTLNTLNALQNAAPRFDHRFTVEHYCISTPAQARRLAALGGLASVNPYFVHYRSQIHADRGFGPDRTESTARLRSLVDAGATFALHSDYNLVVAPMHPLTAAWIAVNRVAADGETIVGPGERISVDRAIRAITVDAAYVLNRDDSLGSIEVGKYADFAVLDDDPYEVRPGALKDIRIHGTVLAGIVQTAGNP
ncbi:MAG: amidohydrolase family protein [Pseudomonadota bacterium]|nr:amidohydrolase family protein [Pseudomonadota bacterium]